jgi:hypothetical protein
LGGLKLVKQVSKKGQTQTTQISRLISEGGPKFLSTLKQKSIRSNNSWYRSLTIDKRRFIEAVIQTVDKIRSGLLLKILTAFTEKLLMAIGGIRGLIGNLNYDMQNFGAPLSKRISIIAEKWGNHNAQKWANDQNFIRYLTVIDMNNLPIFKVSSKL